MVTLRRLLPPLVAVVLAAGCASSAPAATVTVEGARRALDGAVAAVLDGDLARLCERAGSTTMCQAHLADHPAVPTSPPRVTAARQVPARDQHAGGVLLTVEGHDGVGQPYRTDVFVLADADRGPVLQNPVFWSGISVVPAGDESATAVAVRADDPRPAWRSEWIDCGEERGTWCTAVPVDGGEVAVTVVLPDPPAEAGAIPPVVVWEPGGPGLAAATLLQRAGRELLPAPVHAEAAVLAVDARGTAGDAALRCATGEHELWRGDLHAGGPAVRRAGAAIAAGCAPAAAGSRTAVAVADLEAVRRALGLGPVAVLGASYGTRVAQFWAATAPGAVTRLVLDSPVPADTDGAAFVVEQAAAAEAALRRWLQGRERALEALLAGLDRRPVAVDARSVPVTGTDGRLALLRGLADPADWPLLDAALSGDAAVLGTLSDAFTRRSGVDRYPAANAAYWAVLCQDLAWPADLGAVAADAAAVAPVLGPAVAWLHAPCATWPREDEPLAAAAGPVAAPPALVLVVAGDPITGLPWARRTAAALPGAVLHVVDGEGHLALGRGDRCTDAAVAAFLLAAALPACVSGG